MHNFAKKLQYLVIKKDACVISGLICLVHVILAPLCFYYNIDFLCRYHIYAALIYSVVIMLSKAIPPAYLFTMCHLETMCYSLLITFIHGNDAGSYIITLTLLAYYFMLAITSKKPIHSTIIPALLTIAVIFFIQHKAFHPGLIPQELSSNFALIHNLIFSTASIIAIIIITYIIQVNFQRFHDKTKVKTEFLNYSATHDALTKLYNRRRISEIMNNYATKTEYANTLFAASIFDIDNFKKINDNFGHDCGDSVLRTISEIILKSLPEKTILARWGGEEFLILFVGNTSTAEETLENFRERVQDYSFRYFNKAIKLTITLGLSSPDKAYNFSKMLIEADENLMWGKQNGKNRVVTGARK